MSKRSPVTQAIDSIAQCLATAAEAARGLDLAMSQDLRSMLHICACEAGRVRKASRKAAAPKKRAAKAGKKSAKGEAVIAAKQVQQRSKGARRSASAANGAAAH